MNEISKQNIVHVADRTGIIEHACVTNRFLFEHLFFNEENKDLTIHFLNRRLKNIIEGEIQDLIFIRKSMIGNDDDQVRKGIFLCDMLCRLEHETLDIELGLVNDEKSFYAKRFLSFNRCANGYIPSTYEQPDENIRCINFDVSRCILFPEHIGFFHALLQKDRKNKHVFDQYAMCCLEIPKFKITDQNAEDLRWELFLSDDLTLSQKEECLGLRDMTLKKACACVRNFLNDDVGFERYCKEESKQKIASIAELWHS